VTEFLGRERYAKAALTPEANDGMRNGYSPVTVKTTAGPVTLQRPKLRGTTEKFASRLFGEGLTRTNALESLVIAGFVRGLSVRDVEATLSDALGPEAALSKSTVSRVCQVIKEDHDAWDGFLEGLKARGLKSPLLVISDGAAGLVGAIERAFPQALRQRCLVHRCRNVLAKVPKHAQAELKAAYWALFDLAEDVAPGQAAVGLVQARIDNFATKYQALFPSAVACLLDDRAALTSYLRFRRGGTGPGAPISLNELLAKRVGG
jgi:putative transposase